MAGPSPAVRAWSLQTRFISETEKEHVHPERGTETWGRTKRLGAGGFGDVWHEECTSGARARQARAVKQIMKRPDMMQLLSRELDILVALSTDANQPEYLQHFVQFHGWFADDLHLYIAMEFVPFGDLQSHIGQQLFTESETATIVAQVAKALECMHKMGIVHRDLKPANILVSSPRPSWHVKITDFGISKNVEGTALKTKVGTDAYMAPELFESGPLASRGYTSAVDIWGLGAIAYCIQTGRPPFSSAYDIIMFKTDKTPFPTDPLLSFSMAFAFFVQSLMAKQPESRPTIDQVLNHQWIKSLGQIAPAAPKNPTPETNIWDAEATAAWNTSISMPEARTMRPAPVVNEPTVVPIAQKTAIQPSVHGNNTFNFSAADLVIPPYRQTARRQDSGYHEQNIPEPVQIEKPVADEPPQKSVFHEQRSIKRKPLKQVDSGYDETSHLAPHADKKRWNPRHTCLTCGLRFDDRDELFAHIEAEQHGVDPDTLIPEPYVRSSTAGHGGYQPMDLDPIPTLDQYFPEIFQSTLHRSTPEPPRARNQRQKVTKHAHKSPKNNCLMCGKYFRDRDQLFSHIHAKNHYVDPETFEDESSGPVMPVMPVEPAPPVNFSRTTCHTCGESFSSRNELFNHIYRKGHDA